MKFSFKCHLVKIKNLYNNQNSIQFKEDISLMLVTPGRREDARSTCPAASSAPRPRPARCHAHPAPPGTWIRGTRSGRPSPPSWGRVSRWWQGCIVSHLVVSSEPPQKGLLRPLNTSAACQGKLFLSASWPPTILVITARDSPHLHSASPSGMNSSILMNEHIHL